ncbi:cyclin-like protein [Pelagophyceae sp. CCMP2097]|nr:cyclin-like protein [Pelagophyceae sp. CCMP2097]
MAPMSATSAGAYSLAPGVSASSSLRGLVDDTVKRADAALSAQAGDVAILLQAALARKAAHAASTDYVCRVQRDGMEWHWRMKIVEWYVELAASLKFGLKTVAMACSYLDRYHSRISSGSLDFQCAALTAFWLATKVEERRYLTASYVVELSRGIFSSADVVACEAKMLEALHWDVHPGCPFDLALGVCALLRDVTDDRRKVVATRALVLVAAAVFDFKFVATDAATLATAAVFCAALDCGVSARTAMDVFRAKTDAERHTKSTPVKGRKAPAVDDFQMGVADCVAVLARSCGLADYDAQLLDALFRDRDGTTGSAVDEVALPSPRDVSGVVGILLDDILLDDGFLLDDPFAASIVLSPVDRPGENRKGWGDYVAPTCLEEPSKAFFDDSAPAAKRMCMT